MASKKTKKPKGILDDTAGAIKNLVTSLNPKPMETQNLAEYKQTVKNTLKTGATAADLYTTGGVGKSFMQNIVAPGAKVASPKTKSKAESAGLKQFAKDAAVAAGSAAAAYGAGKVVSGIIKSKAANTYYGVHGSATENISKIKPQTGANTQSFLKNIAKTGTTNVSGPKVFSLEPNPANILAASDYAQTGGGAAMQSGGNFGKGSIYLAKTSKSNIVSNMVNAKPGADAMDVFAASGLSGEKMSSKPMKVVKEFKVSNYTQRTYDRFEGGWDTTQDFSAMSGQINQAIAADQATGARLANLIEKGVIPAGLSSGGAIRQKKGRKNAR